MLLRIARASPALARLRPALQRAAPPVLAASITSSFASIVSAPALCMFPPLSPEELVDQCADTIDERIDAARDFVARDRARENLGTPDVQWEQELRSRDKWAWHQYRRTGEWSRWS